MNFKKQRNMFKMRVVAIGGFLMLFAGAAVLRAVDLQINRMEGLKRIAKKQYIRTMPLSPDRGTIMDRNGQILAQTIEVESLYARPYELSGNKNAKRMMAGILGVQSRDIDERLRSDRPFVWIQRQISPSKVKRLKSLGLEGIGFLSERRRFYPNKSLAGHVLGFVGVDLQGLEGAELQFDDVLRGPQRSLRIERDARGREILVEETKQGREASNVFLTIDRDIQYIIEKELDEGVERSGARGGVSIAMDPHTGEILGLAVVPSFNPNAFSLYTPERWRNRGITDVYEPGSTFKVFLLAAALESGAARLDDIFYCENGAYAVGENIIKDDERKYGWLSLKQIMKVSSNIGASKVGERLGKENFFRQIKAFGFGQRTGIDLPGEAEGCVHPARSWPRVSLRTISFGQGISVTPLQMVTALASIANGGYLLRPHILKRIEGSTGTIIHEEMPITVRRVLSPAYAGKVTAVLKAVVEEGGTGEMARISGYDIAGKTGTAQKPELTNGGYSKDKRVASFIGFFPADSPQVVLFVMLDEPRLSPYGGIVAAPVFRRIAEKLVVILDIPPSRDVAGGMDLAGDDGRPIGGVRLPRG